MEGAAAETTSARLAPGLPAPPGLVDGPLGVPKLVGRDRVPAGGAEVRLGGQRISAVTAGDNRRRLGCRAPAVGTEVHSADGGAPHLQSVAVPMPRGTASLAARNASSSLMRRSRASTSEARLTSNSGLKRSRRTISTASPPTSRISISRRRTSDRRSRSAAEAVSGGEGSGGGIFSPPSTANSGGAGGLRAKSEKRRAVISGPSLSQLPRPTRQ